MWWGGSVSPCHCVNPLPCIGHAPCFQNGSVSAGMFALSACRPCSCFPASLAPLSPCFHGSSLYQSDGKPLDFASLHSSERWKNAVKPSHFPVLCSSNTWRNGRHVGVCVCITFPPPKSIAQGICPLSAQVRYCISKLFRDKVRRVGLISSTCRLLL